MCIKVHPFVFISWLLISFHCWVIFHYLEAPVCLLTYCRSSWLLQVWAIMNKAAINIHVQVLCGDKFLIPSGKNQRVWLLNYMIRVFSPLRNCQAVFQRAVPFCIEQGTDDNFRSSTSSSVFGVLGVLNSGHSNKCLVVSHCPFKLNFPDDIWRVQDLCLGSFFFVF